MTIDPLIFFGGVLFGSKCLFPYTVPAVAQVQQHLHDVRCLRATYWAFAAIRNDGPTCNRPPFRTPGSPLFDLATKHLK